jgi:hypothetical protein
VFDDEEVDEDSEAMDVVDGQPAAARLDKGKRRASEEDKEESSVSSCE